MTQENVPVVVQDAHAGQDASRKLARHAVSLPYEALPQAVVELTKQGILDTLGVIVGASGLSPEAQVIYEYVTGLGGREESTLLGFGGKAPVAWASFFNGALGHMLDYDDTCKGPAHPGVTTVPVAFAVGERLGGVSGRDLLTAVATGYDVIARLGQSIPEAEWAMTQGWFGTQLFGYISGAATAGRLLGLDEEQMVNALGIAFNQLSGSRQMAAGEATHVRGMQGGFSGQGAVVAALLAQRGITGPRQILEGRYGLYKTYVRTEEPCWDALVGELGTRFPALETHSFKVWPACAGTRSPIAAILTLRDEAGVHPDNVESITIVGGNLHTALLSEPIVSKQHPMTSIDGKYSIPFTVAVAMAKGAVTLQSFTPEGLRDQDVLSMARRVSYHAVPAEQKASMTPTIEIHTRQGDSYARQVEVVPGDRKNPASPRLLETKFRDCASFAAKPVASENLDLVIRMVADLENVADATEIVRLLGARSDVPVRPAV
jgi:2-methylcitrate dehydratase PrpD